VGKRPSEVIVRSLVAWIAERRETETLEFIDKAIFRMVSEPSGRNESERRNGLENAAPEAELSSAGRRQHGPLQSDRRGGLHSGGVLATARWQGHTKQLERPSSSRGEICGAGSRITGITGKSMEDERELEGSIGAVRRSNVRGAKGPC